VLDGISNITGKIPAFEKLDFMKDKVQVFKRHIDIAGVIHFAASKRLVKVWKTHCCIMK
jgi:UDP-glucose 4-epimerase